MQKNTIREMTKEECNDAIDMCYDKQDAHKEFGDFEIVKSRISYTWEDSDAADVEFSAILKRHDTYVYLASEFEVTCSSCSQFRDAPYPGSNPVVFAGELSDIIAGACTEEDREAWNLTVSDNDTREWCMSDQRHREYGGPALEYANSDKAWYMNGKCYSEEIARRNAPSCEGKIVEVEGRKYKLTAV